MHQAKPKFVEHRHVLSLAQPANTGRLHACIANKKTVRCIERSLYVLAASCPHTVHIKGCLDTGTKV
jgi:hypothetical protein